MNSLKSRPFFAILTLIIATAACAAQFPTFIGPIVNPYASRCDPRVQSLEAGSITGGMFMDFFVFHDEPMNMPPPSPPFPTPLSERDGSGYRSSQSSGPQIYDAKTNVFLGGLFPVGFGGGAQPSSSFYPLRVEAANLDSNSLRPDVAVACRGTSYGVLAQPGRWPGGVSVAFTNGSGPGKLVFSAAPYTFNPLVITGGTFPFSGASSLDLGDVDGDGDNDIVALDGFSHYVGVGYNNGTGFFDNLALTGGRRFQAVQAFNPMPPAITNFMSDLNLVNWDPLTGFGVLPDIAIAAGNANQVQILRNNGLGVYPGAVLLPNYVINVNHSALALAVGDFDSNALPDLVSIGILPTVLGAGLTATYSSGLGASTNVQVPIGALPAGGGWNPIDVEVGEFDGLAGLDVAVLNVAGTAILTPPAEIRIYTNNGTGVLTFYPAPGGAGFASMLPAFQACKDLGVFDENGDGLSELIVSNVGWQLVSIWHNTTTTAGTVTFVEEVLWSECSPIGVTAADFDSIATAPFRPEVNATAFHDVFQEFTRDQLVEVDALPLGGTTTVDINGSIPNTVQTWRNQPITGLPLLRNPEAVNYFVRGSPANTVPASSQGHSLGDVTGDGRADIISINEMIVPKVIEIYAMGVGGAQVALTATAIPAPFVQNNDTVLADFNQDGWLDLAVIGGSPGATAPQVAIYQHTTNPAAPYPAAPSVGPINLTILAGVNGRGWTIEAGDVDGNGFPDFAGGIIASSLFANDQAISLLINTTPFAGAPIAFGAMPIVYPGQPNGFGTRFAFAIALADRDADGDLDVFFIDDTAGAERSGVLDVTILGFGAAIAITLPPPPGSVRLPLTDIAAADLDGDGNADVLLCGDRVTAVYNSAVVGTYVLQVNLPGGLTRAGLLVDLDADSRVDVVASADQGDFIQYLFGRIEADSAHPFFNNP